MRLIISLPLRVQNEACAFLKGLCGSFTANALFHLIQVLFGLPPVFAYEDKVKTSEEATLSQLLTQAPLFPLNSMHLAVDSGLGSLSP